MAIASTIAIAEEDEAGDQVLVGRLDDEVRSFWWKRRRCVADGAIRKIVDAAVASSAA